jgi:thiamine biosynthesis lipoprotein
MSESRATFACFGSRCTVIVAGREAGAALAESRRRLLGWHGQFSRFAPGSELCRLNADARTTVPASPMMRRVVEAGVRAAQATDGLLDPTLVGEIERAGYAAHLAGDGLPLAHALALAPPRARASPSPAARWREISVDRRASTITRPPGVRIDAGGIAKGVFADELAARLGGHEAFAVDCAGDIRVGGQAGLPRDVHVASPFEEEILCTFALADGAAATSGIGRRSWMGADGAPAHHLLDPGTGRPAFTGIVQVTALAPTGREAEVLSKLALLSGPEEADGLLVHGGVIVLDDGSWRAVEGASGTFLSPRDHDRVLVR